MSLLAVCLLGLVVSMETAPAPAGTTLFDFTTISDVSGWREVSDTVRVPGKSKSAMTLQKTKVFQRAVFFAMLNPQPNGACFAGALTSLPSGLPAAPTSVQVQARTQGQLTHWKIYFEAGADSNNYEAKFELAPSDAFSVVDLPLADFKAYYHGKEVPDAPTLDLSQMKSVGVQAYGGVYSTYKQAGTGSLEMDYISLV